MASHVGRGLLYRFFVVSQVVDIIKIVRCGVKSQEYLPVADKRFKNSSPVTGSLGRLVEKKGMDTLILALGRLNREDLDFHLEIAGDGPLMEDSKKWPLKKISVPESCLRVPCLMMRSSNG